MNRKSLDLRPMLIFDTFQNMKPTLPTILFLSCLGSSLVCYMVVDQDIHLLRSPVNYIGFLPLCIGFVIVFRFISDRKRTFRDSNELLRTGVFKISRHPLHLGLAVILLGTTFILGTLSSIVMWIIFMVISEIWSIPKQERSMLRKYGRDYVDYRIYVRKWI